MKDKQSSAPRTRWLLFVLEFGFFSCCILDPDHSPKAPMTKALKEPSGETPTQLSIRRAPKNHEQNRTPWCNYMRSFNDGAPDQHVSHTGDNGCRPWGSKARGFYGVRGLGVWNSARHTIGLFKHQQKNYMYMQGVRILWVVDSV